MLSAMCIDRRLRINPPTPLVQAHNWRPRQVKDSATLSTYDDSAAWEFIADCLNSGAAIEYKPPSPAFNDHAYVMKEEESPGGRRIYMKVAFTRQQKIILGISFHYVRVI